MYENEFDDTDGKPRLINSLEYINSKFNDIEKNEFIDNIIHISAEMSDKQKNELVKVLHHVFKSKELLLKLNKNFDDEYSRYLILSDAVNILKTINNRIKDKI